MTISEACEKLGLTQDTLRYYERIGLLPKVGRNTGGFRKYTEQDCRRITTIKYMRAAGMSINQLAQYIEMTRNGSETIDARKSLLSETRDRLAERIDELQMTLCFLEQRVKGCETNDALEDETLFS